MERRDANVLPPKIGLVCLHQQGNHHHGQHPQGEEVRKSIDISRSIASSNHPSLLLHRILLNNQTAELLKTNRNHLIPHTELSPQQQEFARMAMELSRDQLNPSSPLKMFLKYSPDCIEHLLNQCLVSHCGSDQVQGRIFMDFFMFYAEECTVSLKLSLNILFLFLTVLFFVRPEN